MLEEKHDAVFAIRSR